MEKAFTAEHLKLAQQSYPLDHLQQRYKHLRGLPVMPLKDIQPPLLIGSDQPHLITPIEPVRLGPPGGPATVRTRLGWTLQGPAQFMGRPNPSQQCLLTTTISQSEELFMHVQWLWQVDTVPHRDEKDVTRSKQDLEAVNLLDAKTIRTEAQGVPRFQEYPVAVSGDIKAMFHQVHLLVDRPLLCFLWRELKVDEPPRIFEWQVLPFGTTCSPCCAIYALQHHSQSAEDIRFLVENCFYVDNCLQSVGTPEAAKHLIERLREVLSEAGFDLHQWACNVPSVLSHLPQEAWSESLELWFSHDKTEVLESTLGLSWKWQTDILGYKHRPVIYNTPTLRNIYKVLAIQYDPLGFLLPYTTRAKIIVKQLWDKQWRWDDPNLPPELLQLWQIWEAELQYLPNVILPRPYVPVRVDPNGVKCEIHIFSNASEQAYGAMAYLRTVDSMGQVHLSFILARSRVSPKLTLYSKVPSNWPGIPSPAPNEDGAELRKSVLKEAFAALGPDLQKQLARQKIQFHFNPPAAPHFGGVWEREVRSVKSALYTTVRAQSVPEEVLLTVLLEVEAILKSKPLGYVSVDIADPDPMTPNSLLMGRLDGSLPQVVYLETELLNLRCWKHSQVLADQFWSRFIRDYLPSCRPERSGSLPLLTSWRELW
ncbi:hypothetical protein LDENG_00152830 [Lucifuga dentata]|nr:hypothetical protein LDENG_00152830 [Lucifuga dentata]